MPEYPTITREGAQTSTLERREYTYVMRPKDYEVPGCPCGNDDPDWSEFKGHCWCPVCWMDFRPEHDGVFGGPIPINGAHLMGMCFATVDVASGIVTPCGADGCTTGQGVA